MIKDFEKKALAFLTSGLYAYADVLKISDEAELAGIEHTDAGYFLTIRHPCFSQERSIYSKPVVIGEIPGLVVGFVVFIENGELMLECHGWEAYGVPENIREMDVQVSPARIENGKFIRF